MITVKDLDSAIAECQGKRNPDANTCIKLAAFYTIKREMFGEEKDVGYSFAPSTQNVIEFESDTEFSDLVNGREVNDVLPVIDELMVTLQVIHPKLYNAVMKKLA